MQGHEKFMERSNQTGKNSLKATDQEAQAYRRIIERLQQLPSPPAVAAKIVRMAADENASLEDMVRMLNTDQALNLRVLKMANASAFGLQAPVGS